MNQVRRLVVVAVEAGTRAAVQANHTTRRRLIMMRRVRKVRKLVREI